MLMRAARNTETDEMKMISIEDQQIGLHQAEQNAHISIMEAKALWRGGHYRQVAFFSIVALEAIGKALFLLESLEKGVPLTRKEWKDHRSFFNHLQKLRKAREKHVDRVQKELRVILPGLKAPISIVGFAPEDIEKLWKLRNDLLFVDYNFGEKRWDHPQRLGDMKDVSLLRLSNAVSCFQSLEDILREKGHPTIT